MRKTIPLALSAFGLSALHAETLPIHIQIWTVGDDGLTQQLRHELEIKIGESKQFILVGGDVTPSTDDLVITIPSHVVPGLGNRIGVTYQVEFSRYGRKFSENSGRCWEDELSKCAEQIVSEAKNMVKNK